MFAFLKGGSIQLVIIAVLFVACGVTSAVAMRSYSQMNAYKESLKQEQDKYSVLLKQMQANAAEVQAVAGLFRAAANDSQAMRDAVDARGTEEGVNADPTQVAVQINSSINAVFKQVEGP